MSVELRELAGARLLVADGEMDACTVPPMLAQVPAWAHGAPAVLLDVSTVTFFDSGAVRLVDSLARACGSATAFQVVAPPGSCARRVLELVGMAEGLVHDDVAAACAAVTG